MRAWPPLRQLTLDVTGAAPTVFQLRGGCNLRTPDFSGASRCCRNELDRGHSGPVDVCVHTYVRVCTGVRVRV